MMSDRDAKFPALYAEYALHVWRAARHFGVSSDQLQDITQDVWISAYRQIGRIDLSRPLGPWLTAIVWNHVRHLRRGHARRSRRQQAIEATAEAVQDCRARLGPRSEAAWTLERVLADLPAEQRQILLLCDGEGWSAPEVSNALGVQLNTVYSRLRLARRRCQALASALDAS